ncbi:MAG: thiosulfate/3-mercaptopyruvate sulfurtransferase, partial [Mycobacteriales bacterium]
MVYTTVVPVSAAAAHQRDDDWIFVDCTFELADPAAGQRAYAAGHVPRASYVHLDDDLSGPVVPGRTGRHPLPSTEHVVALLSRLGVAEQAQVVAYDRAGGVIAAARLWWILRWAGHRAAAVLDGGFPAWQGAGLPVSTGAATPARTDFQPHWRDRMVATAADIPSAQLAGSRVVDARPADRYQGRNETLDPVAGHIPGAASLPYGGNLDPAGRLLPPDRLAHRIAAVAAPAELADAIFYCGSGVTAAHGVLAAEYATGVL